MTRTRHACQALLISRQGPTKKEAVFDPKELQAQQVLTEQSGEPSPTLHSEDKRRVGLVKVHWSCAVGTGRGARSAGVNDSRHFGVTGS